MRFIIFFLFILFQFYDCSRIKSYLKNRSQLREKSLVYLRQKMRVHNQMRHHLISRLKNRLKLKNRFATKSKEQIAEQILSKVLVADQSTSQTQMNDKSKEKIQDHSSEQIQNQSTDKNQDKLHIQEGAPPVAGLKKLRNILFGNMLPSEDKRTIIDKDPNSYVMLNPLNYDEQNNLYPQKIYQNDPAPYYPLPVDPKHIPDDVDQVLVQNSDAIRNIESTWFKQTSQKKEPEKRSYQIYSQDPTPYYNPTNDREVLAKPNIFRVGVNYKSQGFDQDEKERLRKKSQMIIRPNEKNPTFYFDPSRIFEDENEDKLQKFLKESRQEIAERNTENLEIYEKREKERIENNNKILNAHIPYDAYQGKGMTVLYNQQRRDQNKKQLERISKMIDGIDFQAVVTFGS